MPVADRPSASIDSNSDDNIGMTPLHDAEHTEDLHDSDSDDVSASDDEGAQSLLGSDDRTRRQDWPVRRRISTWSQVKDIVVETAPTLLFTTVGLLFTGELLDHVSHWKAMTVVDELIIIIPVILNLKGNLEMNLSARLGTVANIGELDDPQNRYEIVLGNLALLQVQATFVSFVAACLSFILGLITPRAEPNSTSEVASNLTTSIIYPRRPRPRPMLPIDDGRPKSGIAEFIMVASTGMTSACLSGLILGSFMCTLVIFCRRFSLNPDNIAPPIASCLGDLITLCLMGLVSAVLINFINTPVPFVLVAFLILSSVTCLYLTRRNKHVRDLLTQGWTPLFGAMVISSVTGLILDVFVSRYSGFALLSVVISGLPGAAGSVFVSRLSTTLHAAASPPHSESSKLVKHLPHPSIRLVMLTLFLVTIPIEIIFLITLRSIGWLQLPTVFIGTSVIFFCVAVLTSLFLAHALTNYLWSKQLDPDLYALPIHSSVIDLSGQLLLVVCFELVSLLGGKVQRLVGQ